MSNLLKGYFVSVEEEKARVVNSNDLVELRIKEEAERRARLQAVSDEGYDVEGDDEGFHEGLNAMNLGDLLDEDSDAAIIKAEQPVDMSMEELENANAELMAIREEIEGLNAQAQGIIEGAQAEADSIKEEAFNQGQNEGYQAGYNQGLAEVEGMKAELEEQARALNAQYESMLAELEPAFIENITDIYEHIFRIDMSMYQGIVKYLLIDTINGNNDARNIIVHISKDDYAMIMSEKEDILTETGMQADNVEFVQDATLKSTDCIIETDNGVFDCSLETELKELKRKLMLLAYH